MVGISDQSTRVGLDCTLFGTQGASAHCLRFGTLWYDVYAVGIATTYYEIEVTLRTTIQTNSGHLQAFSESVTLSVEQPIQTTSDQQLIAKLIGDFAAFQQYPVLVEKYLMIPSKPASDPRVTAGARNWMLIDKTDTALDGTVCNKIGVSFEAFRNEYGACEKVPGSCLNNQLEDFYQSDNDKRNRGLVRDFLFFDFVFVSLPNPQLV
jgi:hypothetical protein